MSDWIAQKPLDQFTWQDINRLVDEQVSEGPTIEFKRELSGKDGNPERWMNGAEKVSDHARDEIFAELSAFANAYGGTLFLGIDEHRDAGLPTAATVTPVPRASKLALKFEDMVRSMFDPPLAGIEVRAIDQPEGDGVGVVVFRVPMSTIAPHGFGKPAAAYVRRSASAAPMTMRDLQSVFWESRSRAEWVLSCRKALEDEVQAQARKVSPLHNGVFARISLIPQQRFLVPAIRKLCSQRVSGKLRPEARHFGILRYAAFGERGFDNGLKPRAHGCHAVGDEAHSQWNYIEDGRVSVSGWLQTKYFEGVGQAVNPDLFLLNVAHVLFAGEILRRASANPHVPLEIDLSIHKTGAVMSVDHGTSDRPYNEGTQFRERSEIGPFVVESRAALPIVASAIEEEIFAAFGLQLRSSTTVNFEQAFADFEQEISEAIAIGN